MDVLERIRAIIAGFAGYDEEPGRRLSDEQIRGFVGEVLALLSAAEVDRLSEADRARFDNLLLRCEFVNQGTFRFFDTEPTSRRVQATLAADATVLESACALRASSEGARTAAIAALSDAFDARDDAMQLHE